MRHCQIGDPPKRSLVSSRHRALFFSSHPMNSHSYICPHCKEEQDDASVTTDGTYLGVSTTEYQCPDCYGFLCDCHLAQLDGVAADPKCCG